MHRRIALASLSSLTSFVPILLRSETLHKYSFHPSFTQQIIQGPDWQTNQTLTKLFFLVIEFIEIFSGPEFKHNVNSNMLQDASVSSTKFPQEIIPRGYFTLELAQVLLVLREPPSVQEQFLNRGAKLKPSSRKLGERECLGSENDSLRDSVKALQEV